MQVSAASHAPTAARHTVPDGSNWQVGELQSPATVLPSSHCSPGSRCPSPQPPDGSVVVVVVLGTVVVTCVVDVVLVVVVVVVIGQLQHGSEGVS